MAMTHPVLCAECFQSNGHARYCSYYRPPVPEAELKYYTVADLLEKLRGVPRHALVIVRCQPQTRRDWLPIEDVTEQTIDGVRVFKLVPAF